MRVEHRLDWGEVKQAGGKTRRFARCTCGWRAPARAKLTHGMSDVRDHLADVKRRCQEQGWEWWMVKGFGLVTEEPDPADEVPVTEVRHADPEPIARSVSGGRA